MRKGQAMPEALRAQVSAKLLGRSAVQNIGLVRSPEVRAKIAASLTGKTHSEETKAKMRAAQQARRAATPVSDETKAKMSALNCLTELLGDDVFFVPCEWGTKKPLVTYVERPFERTKSLAYQVLFDSEPRNVSVYLGKASGGLCAIDFDAAMESY